MEEKTVKDHEGKKHPADTAQIGGAAYAPHDPDAEKLAENADERKADENGATTERRIRQSARSSMRRSLTKSKARESGEVRNRARSGEP